MDYFNHDKSEIFSFELDDQAKSTFHEMARWTKFLAILGFIFLGIIVVAGFFVAMAINNLSPVYSSQFAGIGQAGIILIYLILAAIMFYPAYALLKYSTGMKSALATNNKLKFNQAITYLKNMFKYYGVLAIIFLGFYELVIVIVIFTSLIR